MWTVFAITLTFHNFTGFVQFSNFKTQTKVCGPGQHSQYSHSLRGGRSGDRMPVEARFFTPIQTNPGVHPASYPMSARLFWGIKQPGCGINHPHPSSNKVKERVELYLYSPSGPSCPVLRCVFTLMHTYTFYWQNTCLRKQLWNSLPTFSHQTDQMPVRWAAKWGRTEAYST